MTSKFVLLSIKIILYAGDLLLASKSLILSVHILLVVAGRKYIYIFTVLYVLFLIKLILILVLVPYGSITPWCKIERNNNKDLFIGNNYFYFLFK